MVKRTVRIAILLAALLVGTVCYAAIADEGIAIGGIYYHAPASYVTDIYGAPARTALGRATAWRITGSARRRTARIKRVSCSPACSVA